MNGIRRPAGLSVVAALSVAIATLLAPAHYVIAAPALAVVPTSVGPGDRVTTAGFGFHAGDGVLLTATFTVRGTAQQVQSSSTVSGNGTFKASFTVPDGTAPGVTRVEALDYHNDLAGANLTVLPQVYLQPGTGNPITYVVAGGQYRTRGVGFRPQERVLIRASFLNYSGPNQSLDRTVTADAAGNFTDIFLRVPAGSRAGTVAYTATGRTSGRVAHARVTVTYRAAITLQPAAIRPGGSTTVSGTGYVPNSRVTLTAGLGRTNGQSVVTSKIVTTDRNGSFTTAFGLPTDVRVGSYTLLAADALGGARAQAALTVTVHPVLALTPRLARPGDFVTVTGGGYGYFVPLTLRAVFRVLGGGTRTVALTLATGANGAFGVRFQIPTTAITADVVVSAASSNSSAQAILQVRRPVPPRPRPTSTPLPTATSTPLPTATTTAVPTATATPHHKHPFRFKYISVWYHSVHVGTSNHIVVQGSPRTVLGLWVHVYFPNGTHDDFYENTDAHGFWQKDFSVGRVLSQSNNQAVITFRLWHGAKSRRSFVSFTIER